MKHTGARITVLLADENGVAGAATRGVIESISDLDLAWDAHEIPEVLRLVQEVHPDLILLSHDLLKSQLATAIRAIAEKSPVVKILLLSTHNDSRFALRAIEAGAAGYLLKERVFEELANAVKAVTSGRVYLSPGIAGMQRVRQTESALANAEAVETAKKSPERTKRRPRSRILVVDDEEAIREMYRLAFEQVGYAVTTAGSGVEAIAALHSEPPDVAFVDLVMPRSNGVKVIRAIREMDETLPVVVVTAYPDSDLMYQAMAYSPLLVLAKPVRMKALLEAARSALAGRLATSPRIE